MTFLVGEVFQTAASCNLIKLLKYTILLMQIPLVLEPQVAHKHTVFLLIPCHMTH